MNENKKDWGSRKLSDEASLTTEDEIKRRILRGDETKGDPDGRDNAGAPDRERTPEGKKEREKDIEKEHDHKG